MYVTVVIMNVKWVFMCIYEQARAALTMDSVQVVIHGLTSLFNEEPDILRRTFRHGHVYNGEKRGIQCKDPPDKWIHGRTIMQHFRKASIYAYTHEY